MVRADIILEDTTLRDGEQSPGVAFTKQTKLAIHDLLVAAGVRWIEAGIPVMGGEEAEALRELVERGSPATLVAWNRGVREDVTLSLDLGFRAVHIGLPTSKVHLRDSINKSREWLLKKACELIALAKDRGAFVSISAEDIGRTETSFLQEYAGRVAAAGADRLRLSDTIGILTPAAYAAKVAALVGTVDVDLQCHAHNDFGLAVANTLAGLEAGARYFHVTVNGIGERAGMADIAQVAFALKHLYGHDLGLDGPALKRLSDFVARATGCQPPPWYPIVGRNVFAHESGIHVKGMLSNQEAFEPIAPEEIGAERHYVLGKHSGGATIRYHLEQSGIAASDVEVQRCLSLVRAEAIARGGAIPPEELTALYHRVSERVGERVGEAVS